MQVRRWTISALLLVLFVVGAVPTLAQDTVECEAGFRLFTNDLLWEGTADGVCIPETAERVIIANHPTYLLDNTLALGLTPVGTAIYLDRFAVAPYLADDVEGIEYVGSYNEPKPGSYPRTGTRFDPQHHIP